MAESTVVIPNIWEVKWIVNRNLPEDTWTFWNGQLMTDSEETLERMLNFLFLRSCGIQADNPRYIWFPDIDLNFKWGKALM